MLFVVLAIILSFFLWATLHELFHALMIKKFIKEAKLNFKLYPHFENNNFVWASVSYSYLTNLTPSDNQMGWVFFAPRIIDVIGCLLTIVLSTLVIDGPYKLIYLILAGGSIVDLLVGSIGYSKQSDLQRYCKYWNLNPFIARAVGFSISIFTALVAYLLL